MPGEAEVVELEGRGQVGCRGHIDDARTVPALQQGAKHRGEQKRREVVGLESCFVAVDAERASLRTGPSGVVDQDVEPLGCVGYPSGERAHLRELVVVGAQVGES
jgi:hypothetical protein